MKNQEKVLMISICGGLIARNLLSVPGGFLTHAKRQFEKIIIVVPENTRHHFEEQYADNQVIIETVTENIFQHENDTVAKKLFSFFYSHLLFTTNAKRLAWEGIYGEVKPKDTWYGRLKYAIKWFVGNTFGHSQWVRIRFCAFIDSLLHRKQYHAALFEKYQPSVVLAPNVEKWSDICLIREAKKHGIPSVGLPGSWDHFPKRFRPLHPGVLLVNTYTQMREAIEYQSYNSSKIFVVGVPYYDAFSKSEFIQTREEFCKKFGLLPDRKIIFFSSESVYAPDEGDISDMIYNWIVEKKLQSECQLFVRPYPGVSSEHDKFDSLEGSEGVYIDWIENTLGRAEGDAWYPSFKDIAHFMNCLYHADVVINTYSSIAIEAAYFNKQPIWTNFDGHKKLPWDESVKRLGSLVHIKNITETGGVITVNSPEELLKEVNNVLTADGPNSRLEVLRHKMCGPLDGRTGERIVDHLVRISNK